MFTLTKIDSIPDNYQKYHIHNNLLISIEYEVIWFRDFLIVIGKSQTMIFILM